MGARVGALSPARPPVRGGTRRLLRHGGPQVRTAEIKYKLGYSHQGVTKRCLSWLTNSTFVYEPKWGWGVEGSQPMGTAVHRDPNKLWRSNSTLKLWFTLRRYLHWTIYRRPGFLAVVWFGSSPSPFPPSLVSKLDRRHTGRLRKRDNLLTGKGGDGDGGRGAESYVRKKAWPSINHSILSVHTAQSVHSMYCNWFWIWFFENLMPHCAVLSIFLSLLFLQFTSICFWRWRSNFMFVYSRRKEAELYENIMTRLRPEPEYFRVAFYGRSFPAFLQNKGPVCSVKWH